MPAIVNGDYSKYPEEIREIIQYLSGECAELHSNWDVFKHFFMEYEERTNITAEYMGSLLGMFQRYLFENMILGVCRLLDEDKGRNKNLTLCALAERARSWDVSFGNTLEITVQELRDAAKLLIDHRNKSIAHSDLKVSFGDVELDLIKPSQLLDCITRIAEILNKVHLKATGAEMFYDGLDPRDITLKVEYAVAKAAAFDEMLKTGKATRDDWTQFVKTPPSPYRLQQIDPESDE